MKSGKLGVIGLGYVGLPLAVAFARTRKVVGFDRKAARVEELSRGADSTEEVPPEELAAAKGLSFSSDPEALRGCDAYVVCVPTPVDDARQPDFSPLVSASRTVGSVLGRGAVVVYESTVYPGATEEVCVPELERASGLVFNRDFFVGYSPERINPGDRTHRLSSIRKIVSGSTPEAAARVEALYAPVIAAGVYRAGSIRVAEAAKVIENTQRDVNIALMNELAQIFDRMGIDTTEVLEAAGTKWNFLPFRPGLVGGHCIGVDPYYLAYQAQRLGFHPDVILAGRRTNDGMGGFVASRVVKLMSARGIPTPGSRVLVLGLTFKEDCPDVRNTRVPDIVRELSQYGCACDVADPRADAAAALRECGVRLVEPERGAYDAVVLAVAHRAYREAGAAALHAYGKPGAHVLFDVKAVLPASESDGRL